MPEKKETFGEFCFSQVRRLGVFERFGYLPPETLKDYRKWLENKCQTKPFVVAVMDAAVELEQMPTIADLNRIFAGQVAPKSYEPEPREEEKQAQANYMRMWREQEEREAAERRAKRLNLGPDHAGKLLAAILPEGDTQ